MGDLVEGIGDEVLLFGAFLALTACIVIVVNVWQGRSGRDRQPRTSQGKYFEGLAIMRGLFKLSRLDRIIA